VSSISTKPPSGTRDFLPDDVRRREHVIGVIRGVYEQYGYEPLETPAFENLETLLGKYGDEGNKLIFKILKRGEHERSGEADLALRYDLTVPLARVVAQYQNALPRFFRRYQIQPVWRADRPAKGRFREFFQCDIDAIGSPSPLIEAEQIGAVGDVLTRLGFTDFVIRLNHRLALRSLLECAGIPEEKHGEALVAVDKLDKIGVDGVERELRERGVAPDAASACLSFFAKLANRAPADADPLVQLGEFVVKHPSGPPAVAALADLVRLTDQGPASGRVRVDPSLARGLSYYTGAIMEVAVPDLAGSLGGGGRYDNLIGMFLGRDVPACGVSLGLERILVVMGERGMFPASVTSGAVDIMVTIWGDTRLAEAAGLAALLRKSGLRVEMYPEPDKLGKQFKHASSRQIPFVAIEGDDERATGTVALKDLRSGEQIAIARNQAAAYVLQRLERRP